MLTVQVGAAGVNVTEMVVVVVVDGDVVMTVAQGMIGVPGMIGALGTTVAPGMIEAPGMIGEMIDVDLLQGMTETPGEGVNTKFYMTKYQAVLLS